MTLKSVADSMRDNRHNAEAENNAENNLGKAEKTALTRKGSSVSSKKSLPSRESVFSQIDDENTSISSQGNIHTYRVSKQLLIRNFFQKLKFFKNSSN